MEYLEIPPVFLIFLSLVMSIVVVVFQELLVLFIEWYYNFKSCNIRYRTSDLLCDVAQLDIIDVIQYISTILLYKESIASRCI